MHVANGTHWYQPAAPAPYFQPAAGVRAIQNAHGANLPIVRKSSPAPAPPKRNDSGRLPVATVKGVPLLEITKHNSPYQNAGYVPERHFYWRNAITTSWSWSEAGALTGTVMGCLIAAPVGFMAGGPVGAGVGCAGGATFGSQIGSISYGIVGFIVGAQVQDPADIPAFLDMGPGKAYTGGLGG